MSHTRGQLLPAVPPCPRPGRRLLVTGARGFIGTALVSRLVAAGHEVHATTRHDTAAGDDRAVRWWPVDLTADAETDRVVHGARPDVVIHLAGRASGRRDLEAVGPMVRDNVLSTTTVMSAVARHAPHARTVVAGSIEEPRSIAAGRGAHSPYAAAKAAGTIYATLYRDLWELDVVVLRPAMVYGPGDHHGSRLIPHVVDSLLAGVPPRIGSGDRAIDWVYVDDVVDAFVAAAGADAAGGGIVDVGSGRAVTIRDTVERVTAQIGTAVRPRFGALPDRALDRAHIADPVPARELLGWSATTPLDDGLRATIDWFRHRTALAAGL